MPETRVQALRQWLPGLLLVPVIVCVSGGVFLILYTVANTAVESITGAWEGFMLYPWGLTCFAAIASCGNLVAGVVIGAFVRKGLPVLTTCTTVILCLMYTIPWKTDLSLSATAKFLPYLMGLVSAVPMGVLIARRYGMHRLAQLALSRSVRSRRAVAVEVVLGLAGLAGVVVVCLSLAYGMGPGAEFPVGMTVIGCAVFLGLFAALLKYRVI